VVADREQQDDKDDDGDSYLQHIETPLHACSLETLPRPIRTPSGDLLWPMMLGCYELTTAAATTTTTTDSPSGIRKGHLDLYAVKVPDDDSIPIHLDHPLTIIQGKPVGTTTTEVVESSGILDGKWWWWENSSSTTLSSNDDDETKATTTTTIPSMFFATAHATGEIQVHSVEPRWAVQNDESTVSPPDQGDWNDVPWKVTKLGQSNVDHEGLCLSLAWEGGEQESHSTTTWRNTCLTRNVISSYSDGHVTIHKVHLKPSSSSSSSPTNPLDSSRWTSAEFIETHSWMAHRMFKSPAEVWTACFAPIHQRHTDDDNSNDHTNVVFTGGDEGLCKVWDLRLGGTQGPIHTIDTFGAGVTILSPHPRKEYWIACGSYDETIQIWDIRMLTQSGDTKQGRHPQQRTLFHSESQGGGIWRMKWHPYDDYRLLLGVMHGGCRVVDLLPTHETKDEGFEEHDENEEGPFLLELKERQSFTRHESMAYGADWLAYTTPHRHVETAASCSFYDKSLYTWNVNRQTP